MPAIAVEHPLTAREMQLRSASARKANAQRVREEKRESEPTSVKTLTAAYLKALGLPVDTPAVVRDRVELAARVVLLARTSWVSARRGNTRSADLVRRYAETANKILRDLRSESKRPLKTATEDAWDWAKRQTSDLEAHAVKELDTANPAAS